MQLSKTDAVELYYCIESEPDLEGKIGADGDNMTGDTPPTFTAAEAERIYYAVVAKRDEVASGFYGRDRETREWRAHLNEILDQIGEKGRALQG